MAIIKMARLISYEIVCAIPRIAPRRANLLFEAQPANKRGYKFKLKQIKSNKIDIMEARTCSLNKLRFHTIKTRTRARAGDSVNKLKLLVRGDSGSLVKSLMASAIG